MATYISTPLVMDESMGHDSHPKRQQQQQQKPPQPPGKLQTKKTKKPKYCTKMYKCITIHGSNFGGWWIINHGLIFMSLFLFKY